jgi:hypothetical protein
VCGEDAATWAHVRWLLLPLTVPGEDCDVVLGALQHDSVRAFLRGGAPRMSVALAVALAVALVLAVVLALALVQAVTYCCCCCLLQDPVAVVDVAAYWWWWWWWWW